MKRNFRYFAAGLTALLLLGGASLYAAEACTGENAPNTETAVSDKQEKDGPQGDMTNEKAHIDEANALPDTLKNQ